MSVLRLLVKLTQDFSSFVRLAMSCSNFIVNARVKGKIDAAFHSLCGFRGLFATENSSP